MLRKLQVKAGCTNPDTSDKTDFQWQKPLCPRSIDAEECPDWKFTKTPCAKDEFAFRDGDANNEVTMKARRTFQNHFSQTGASTNSYLPSDADWGMPTMNGKLKRGNDGESNGRIYTTTSPSSASVQRNSRSFKSDYRLNIADRSKETTRIVQRRPESKKIGHGANAKDIYKYTGAVKKSGIIYPTRSV